MVLPSTMHMHTNSAKREPNEPDAHMPPESRDAIETIARERVCTAHARPLYCTHHSLGTGMPRRAEIWPASTSDTLPMGMPFFSRAAFV